MRATAPCRHCEAKDEEIAYLRSELALIDDMDACRKLQTCANLRGPTEARILLHFMRCRHHTATRLQLADLLKCEDGDPKAVDVFMSRIRGRMGQDMFETMWGYGWRLTPTGFSRLQAIVSGDVVPAARPHA